MRKTGLTLILIALTACGPRVTGEVGKACINGGRSAANARLCTCVQQAANQTLNGSEQIRAAAFFAEPDLAQATRQSDNGGDERFWDRYKVFADTARRQCR
ncbi:MAG: arginine transporter [Pseudomonadota bacterium]